MSTLRLPDLKVGACSGLTLHFDKLSVLSPSASSSGPRGMPKEASLLYPPSKAGLGAAERVKLF